jgi:hypothetical protein
VLASEGHMTRREGKAGMRRKVCLPIPFPNKMAFLLFSSPPMLKTKRNRLRVANQSLPKTHTYTF